MTPKQIVQAAVNHANPLDQYLAPMKRYKRTVNDSVIDLTLSYHHSADLNAADYTTIYTLCESNMQQLYDQSRAREWRWNAKKKRQQLQERKGRYIIVRATDGAPGQDATVGDKKYSEQPLVAFVQFQHDVENDTPILYIYELQIASSYQRCGLGRYLMQICELLSVKLQLQQLYLTVLKQNTSAMKFYRQLGYKMDISDPSHYHDGVVFDYEIWSKPNKLHAANSSS